MPRICTTRSTSALRRPETESRDASRAPWASERCWPTASATRSAYRSPRRPRTRFLSRSCLSSTLPHAPGTSRSGIPSAIHRPPTANARRPPPWFTTSRTRDSCILEARSGNPTAELRAAILNLEPADVPVMVKCRYEEPDTATLAVKAAADLGPLLLDGLADGIWIDAPGHSDAELHEIELMILQAARVRFSRTEYIACPSCGRTLYDIEQTLCQIKARTSHLKNLRIGVMGCIVNGRARWPTPTMSRGRPRAHHPLPGPRGRRTQHPPGGGARPACGADPPRRQMDRTRRAAMTILPLAYLPRSNTSGT